MPRKKLKLPPDPEDMNDSRAKWANAALNTFMAETRTDPEDSVCDLLADLMHWCDRNGMHFNTEFARARAHYRDETTP